MSLSKEMIEEIGRLLDLTKHPVDVIGSVKSTTTGEYIDAMVSGLNAAETFASMIKKLPFAGTAVTAENIGVRALLLTSVWKCIKCD